MNNKGIVDVKKRALNTGYTPYKEFPIEILYELTYSHWSVNDYWCCYQLGLEPHHGVCILGYNSPEWVMSHLAAIMAG